MFARRGDLLALSTKVSIITVCYNSEKTIEQTIKSVIGQTYQNIEYLIIDGGSKDKTIEIIKKYDDKIAYWISEPDNGIYDAMNKGLQAATGEVIGIINSDDWYDEKTIANVVAAFLEYDCEFIHGDIVRVYDDLDFSVRCHPASIESIWHRTAFYHPTWFIKKSLYERHGLFRTELFICGDYELLLRLYTQDVKFHYLPDDLAYYRMSGFSNKQTFLGYREIRALSIEYGYNKVKAYLWYYKKVTERRIYNIISRSRVLLKAYFQYMHKER